MRKLEGKVAVITGGAAGLGRAMAQRLAADGATVVITDIDADTGSRTADEIGASFLLQDVTDELRWDAVVQQVLSDRGRFDILINNAGILGPATNINPEVAAYVDWKKVMTINVDSVFLGCRAAIKGMRSTGRGGAILNVSSVAGLLASPYATAYGASKAAVRQLTKSVAQYCAQERLGVRCNSLHPGDVYTPLHDRRALEQAEAQGVSVEEVLEASGAVAPLGGWVPIEQIAAAASYLVSDEASFVTGTAHVVDGGLINLDTYHLTRQSTGH